MGQNYPRFVTLSKLSPSPITCIQSKHCYSVAPINTHTLCHAIITVHQIKLIHNLYKPGTSVDGASSDAVGDGGTQVGSTLMSSLYSCRIRSTVPSASTSRIRMLYVPNGKLKE